MRICAFYNLYIFLLIEEGYYITLKCFIISLNNKINVHKLEGFFILSIKNKTCRIYLCKSTFVSADSFSALKKGILVEKKYPFRNKNSRGSSYLIYLLDVDLKLCADFAVFDYIHILGINTAFFVDLQIETSNQYCIIYYKIIFFF